MRKHVVMLAAVTLACGSSDPSVATEIAGRADAERLGALPGNDRFIVVFRPGVREPERTANELVQAHGGTLGFVYRHALSGFSVELPAAAAAALARNPLVSYVEPDQVAYAFSHTVPTGIRRIFADGNPNLRIDGVDDVRIDVDVAVIDTGIDWTHPDLNVVARTDCSGGSPFRATCSDGSGDDGNGHGTHVAGTIAALDNDFGVVGVAPGARLWAVKVLSDNGSGWNSGVIAGVDWVTARASSIEVANMSLGGGNSQALCDAVRASVAAGVVHAVAAGNSDADAGSYSPANCPDAITVSALADFDGLAGGLSAPTCRSDQDDTLADFSNWGAAVDIAAPGVCILSTWKGGGYATLSGTSMAAPHVAGAAALLKASGVLHPLTVRETLLAGANLDWTDDSGDGRKEPLLDVSGGAFAPATVPGPAPAPPPEDPPPADDPSGAIALSASGYKVKGVQHAGLAWSGATSENVDLFRDGVRIATVPNDGAYDDDIGKRGGGSYAYRACEGGTNTCSAEAIVTF
jgi:subtilisin